MARTPKAKTTETTKKTSVKKAVVKTEEPKAEPVKTHGTYMDENGVIDWDKLKALLK
jgi:hypothetical protein